MANYGWAPPPGQPAGARDNANASQEYPNMFPEPRPYAESSTSAEAHHSGSHLTWLNTGGVLINTVSNVQIKFDGTFDITSSREFTADSQRLRLSILRTASDGLRSQFPIPPSHRESVPMTGPTLSMPVPTFPNTTSATPAVAVAGPPDDLPFPSANSIEEIEYNLDSSTARAEFFKSIVSCIFMDRPISYDTLCRPLDPDVARQLGMERSKYAYSVFLRPIYDENGGGTQYTCALCERANRCNAEREALRHVLKYHLGVGIKCSDCEEICWSTTEMTRHRNTRHPN